ncbi:hypothetical protein Q1695_006944 [Nippostrongylus brasiliensis]|nr:hypothetical protein Q1695_006944 [Nippostrongylus brasiliensis]
MVAVPSPTTSTAVFSSENLGDMESWPNNDTDEVPLSAEFDRLQQSVPCLAWFSCITLCRCRLTTSIRSERRRERQNVCVGRVVEIGVENTLDRGSDELLEMT